MLQKLQKRKESGFTIIEVLIVLAIAGLILLVVFLAVPALQRNSRNTTYRNEASRLLDAYGEVSANQGGAILSGSAAAANANLVKAAANTKNITNVSITTQGSASAPSSTDTAVIATGAKCVLNNGAYSTAAGSTRQVVILFLVETSSGTTEQCVEG